MIEGIRSSGVSGFSIRSRFVLVSFRRVDEAVADFASLFHVRSLCCRLDDSRAFDVRFACSCGRCDCSDWVFQGSVSFWFRPDFPFPSSLPPLFRSQAHSLSSIPLSRLFSDRIHRSLPRERNRLRLPLPRNPTRPRIQTHLLRRSRSRRLRWSFDPWVPVHRAGEDGVEDLEEVVW